MNSICNFFKGSLSRNLLLILLLSGCASRYQNQIASINIIDRNGMSETISEKSRLNPFQNTDFLSPQPYQKVLRVYARSETGDVRSEITSYYPNGQIQQYLESVNNRAFGIYREWHPNGQKKIESCIIGGSADLNTQAQSSWLFDGQNRAWNEEGVLIANIPYKKGEIEGVALYYHPNGALWKSAEYSKNTLHGCFKLFLSDGTLLQTTSYAQGLKEGKSLRYWAPEKIAAEEIYTHGLLTQGFYWNSDGSAAAEIVEGNGFKALFGKESLEELQEYKNGEREGMTQLFNSCGHLEASYHIKNGEKHGEEMFYFASSTPKLSMTWQEGILQGPIKTWYENGAPESQKEMSQNKKNGLFTAWYKNGSLMIVEEYDNDRLVKGEYFRSGEKEPVSTIEKGRGTATLFDSEGHFAKKIDYQEGRPLN